MTPAPAPAPALTPAPTSALTRTMSDTLVRYAVASTPVGDLLLTSQGEALTRLAFPDAAGRHAIDPSWRHDPGALAPVCDQVGEYFAGERRAFDLPLAPRGTPFQQRVWQALQLIPYGATWSYGQLARWVGVPGGARAVGLANGQNPISIVVPCHRVIGAGGALTGYGGGLPRKVALLELERRYAGLPSAPDALF